MFLRMCMLFGLVLASCGPTHAPILAPTPIVEYRTIGLLYEENDMTAEIHISAECVNTGQPLHILVDITHTGDTTYSATLDEPIFDIVLDAYRFNEQWRWSDTIPAEDIPFNVTLAPSATYSIQWTWTVDPLFAMHQAPKPITVNLVFQQRSAASGEIIPTQLSIAHIHVDSRDGIVCPM